MGLEMKKNALGPKSRKDFISLATEVKVSHS